MAGTYEPIAALSPDNQGPALTVVAIILSATSVLFFSVRYAIGRKRLLQLDSDDATFCVALVRSSSPFLESSYSLFTSVSASQLQWCRMHQLGLDWEDMKIP